MKRKKIIKIALIVIVIIAAIGGGSAYYMFNIPHRNVQETETDYQLQASAIVNEYLADQEKANQKYLDSEGESKVIEIAGTVKKIETDFNNNQVLLLQAKEDKAGVSCTFTPETNTNAATLKIGDKVSIKGVIRAGASFDSDLDMYENVIMEKCDLITKK